jgi:hypothetical protein
LQNRKAPRYTLKSDAKYFLFCNKNDNRFNYTASKILVDHKQTNNNDARLQVFLHIKSRLKRGLQHANQRRLTTHATAKPHKLDYINAYSIMAQSLSMQLVYVMRLKRNCNGKAISTPHIISVYFPQQPPAAAPPFSAPLVLALVKEIF